MNYEHPDLLDVLAASYALGLVRGGARMRFERLCQSLPLAMAARIRWEDRFVSIALAEAPVEPSRDLWSKISARINASADRGQELAAARSRFGQRRWRMAAAASLLAVALLIGKLTIWNEPTWQEMAVLAPANATPLWRIERTADSRRLVINTIGVVHAPTAKSYELWVLPGGGTPVSLGLLPARGRLERSLTAGQQHLLRTAMQVAVSVEPMGGSPTGRPTGPVVIVAPIIAVAG
jgi:anti-sigma-K factor RskA